MSGSLFQHKNFRLLLVLLVLTAITLLFWLTKNNGTNTSVDRAAFSVSDTAQITKIKMTNDIINNTIVRQGDQWEINNKYKVDNNFIYILKSILKVVTVSRPVAASQHEEVRDLLLNMGIKVEIYQGDELVKNMYVGGIRDQRRSYFMQGEQLCEVNYPGYNSYIAGMFELREHEWRDKAIVQADWRTIKQLSVTYEDDTSRSYKIVPGSEYMYVENIDKLDTLSLALYLDQFQNLKVAGYILKGTDDVSDSLSSTSPIAQLEITNIDVTNNVHLNFFIHPRQKDYMMITNLDNENMALIPKQSALSILRSREDFIAKSEKVNN